MKKLLNSFISNNGRLHTVVGIERDNEYTGYTTGGKNITGLVCQDAQTYNIWVIDIKYFNPLKNNKKGWKKVLLMDRLNTKFPREF